MTRSRSAFPTRPLAVSLLAAAILVATAHAQVVVESRPGVVRGTAPVVTVMVSNESRANQAPVPGDVLKANPTVADAEQDEIKSITYRWLRGDVEIGTGETYSMTPQDSDQQLRVEVTASTDDASTNPSSGTGTATVTTGNAAPVASNLTIEGTRAVGQTLTAKFDYTDAEDDEAGDHLYSWCRRGYTCEISTESTYTLVDADYSREITFEVIPVAKTGTPQGAVARSEFGLALIPGRPPVATNVSISGSNIVGSVLTANYTYSDPDGDAQSGTTFNWCWRGITCGKGSGPTYTTGHEDHGKEISVEVTPKSSGNMPNTGAMVSAHLGKNIQYPIVTIGDHTLRVPNDGIVAHSTGLLGHTGNASSSSVVRVSVGISPGAANADDEFLVILYRPDGNEIWRTTCKGSTGYWTESNGLVYPKNCYDTAHTVDLSSAPRAGVWRLTAKPIAGSVPALAVQVTVDMQ